MLVSCKCWKWLNWLNPSYQVQLSPVKILMEAKLYTVNFRLATLLKETLQHRLFVVKFEKFLRILFLKNICERLLLSVSHDWKFTSLIAETHKVQSFATTIKSEKYLTIVGKFSISGFLDKPVIQSVVITVKKWVQNNL